MAAAAVPAAVGLSLASTGFSVAGELEKGKGAKAAAEFEAARLERAAALGRIKADQSDTFMREELTKTIAGIDVIRAAANTSQDSPTAIAIRDEETRVSERERATRRSNILAQVDEDETAAKFKRSVGESAIRASYLSAGAVATKGLASAFSSAR